jgi:hypothetical protein
MHCIQNSRTLGSKIARLLTEELRTYFLRQMLNDDPRDNALQVAAASAQLASIACRIWEEGGEADSVSDTAFAAIEAAKAALGLVAAEESWDTQIVDPETRQGRLALAGWFALLAGTDEHGESSDLDDAMRLFRRAADA